MRQVLGYTVQPQDQACLPAPHLSPSCLSTPSPYLAQSPGRRRPHSLSFQEVLDRRRWKRQLLMRRVAALWMYTEFFMMTGILASSSAFRMHSSKNPVSGPWGGATASFPPRSPRA